MFRILLLCAAIACTSGGRSLCAQGFAPSAAANHFQTPGDLRAELFAHEPRVRQPIFVKFDDRGRLWTIQYLQYPNPAGLQRTKVDRWSRTVYDRIPKPPPEGPRGADRITIVTDVDNDGRADHDRDFVDGLNLCTGLAFGYGGVFVLQTPYLLFYEDKNRDDRPDGPPQVLLTGFGMEDAQSLANHLTWGPDGWLYGVNGSTTTCRIRGIEFQQGCWRYHPRTKEFELFCEGGGNTYGLTFDENGELFYSTNGGPFVHAVQGGYYYKSFGKHGPLHNLFAYHHLPPLARDQVPGGPPTGGTIYAADEIPGLRGKFVAGNFLGHTVSSWTVKPTGVTVSAQYDRALFHVGDRWAGPTDLCVAPDGSLYICDFYDQRTAHPDPDARWDRSNGRIYRLAAKDHPAKPEAFDLRTLSSVELVALLKRPNRWFGDRARVLLAERQDSSVWPVLKEMVINDPQPRVSLQALWALHVSGGLDDSFAIRCLQHDYGPVRSWAVRFLGDAKRVSARASSALRQLANDEPSPAVRLQLAASAKRLPAQDGLPIVQTLLDRGLDDGDERISWSLWWALESKAISDRDQVLERFARPALWSRAAYRGNLRRLIRRYAAAGDSTGYDASARILETVPTTQRSAAIAALAQGLAERSQGFAQVGQGGLFSAFAAEPGEAASRNRDYAPVSGRLRETIKTLWRTQPTNANVQRMAFLIRMPQAHEQLTEQLKSLRDLNAAKQRSVLNRAAEFGSFDDAQLVVRAFAQDLPADVQLLALEVFSRRPSAAASEKVLEFYERLPEDVQRASQRFLLSREASAGEFLRRVDRGKIRAEQVSLNRLRNLQAFENAEINRLVTKHWGRVSRGSSEERLAAMRRFNNDLRAGTGDAQRGKAVYQKHCGNCHRVFGAGGVIGPDLTQANRKDRTALLANLVDPSAVVKRQYLNYVLTTDSGRVLTGLIAEQDGASVTIVDAENRRTRVNRKEIDSLRESPNSLMPDGLLEKMQPQEIRDLFQFLSQ